MKFSTPAELGAWAQAHSVARVVFGEDGALREVEFNAAPPTFEFAEGDTDEPVNPNRKAVNNALALLAAGKVEPS